MATHRTSLLLIVVRLAFLEQTQLLHCSHPLPANSGTLHVAAQCPESHAVKLLTVKRSFSFTDVINNEPTAATKTLPSWREGTDCCRWEGIGCDNATGLVTLLDLSNRNLQISRLPSDLFRLASLQYLNLAFNTISSSQLPVPGFESLTQLTYLNLSNCNFVGQVPVSISRLTNLATLDLGYNPLLKLHRLSNILASLSKLKELHLDRVNITATAPECFNALGKHVPLLQILSLNGCGLSGPIVPSLSSLHSLSMLHHNLFTTVEQPLDHVHIGIVDLSFNKLRGTVAFPYDGYMLAYSNNKFSSIPSGSFLRQVKSTYSVDLSNNELSGTIPYADCHSHDALQILDLSGNNLSGLVPPYLLKGCNDLEVLNLRGNRLGGTWPDDMDESCNLKLVDLHGNQMEGRLPRSLARCQYLVALDVGGNHFLDSFPSWLAKLPVLQLLILRHNKFHGPVSIPALGFGDQNNSTTAAGYFSRVRIIDLAGNGFNGDLASDFFKSFESMVWDPNPNGTADYEHTLYASAGRSSYQVAVDVAMKQQYMRVAKVRSDLVVIDLSSNRFSGFIPWSIGGLTSLHVVNLSRNAFAGGIPGELGLLHQLLPRRKQRVVRIPASCQM
ncbi:hypothetical protein ACQ4PT_063027 [Festuca glaucescens]